MDSCGLGEAGDSCDDEDNDSGLAHILDTDNG
jgi:hypothetical protein